MHEENEYDFFIAHASADQAEAKRLFELLAGEAKVFLDTACLLPGDDWPTVIRDAQRRSLVTVVLISERSGRAFYEVEEIAAAIELARQRPRAHRVVPVYLSGRQPDDVPYGLRQKSSLEVTARTPIEHVAGSLLALSRILPATTDVAASGPFGNPQSPAALAVQGDGELGGLTAATPVVLAQLPASVPGFTGRREELAKMTRLLDPAGPEGPVVVSAVAGLAGVGKTALAVEAGHAALRRGWFPSGVLFIDLHGYDKVPVESAQALDALLRTLGVPAENILPDPEEREKLYRVKMAQIKDPMLVIADNASSEAQVRPLLPGAGRHKAVVTSRHTLADLDAALVDVTVLDHVSAVDLLDRALRVGHSKDDRITGDRDGARRLAEVCGGLPLALRIVAALLKAELTLSAGELAEELMVESERLEQLRYGNGSGPNVLSVEAAFELSYRRLEELEEVQARIFRLLPVNPGPDLSTAAAADLADLPVREVRQALRGLGRAHLVEKAPGADGRWRMHDLLRLYARRLSDKHADADGREQARKRILNYYLSIADVANNHLEALPGMVLSENFTGRDDALAWLDAERPNLVAAVTMAARARDKVAVELPLALAQYFYRRRRLDDWLATLDKSLQTARLLGDRTKEGTALARLGWALNEAGRPGEAILACQDAVTICREFGDRHGEGMALNTLGRALHQVRRLGEAIAVLEDAVAICRETGDRHEEGIALTNRGLALGELGRLDEAITAHQDAVAICQEIGDRREEGMVLTNLGGALRKLGRLDEAIIAHQDAVAICQETGDRHGKGIALGNLGGALREVRRFEDAIAAYKENRAICRETGDRHGEGMVLDNLGIALREADRFEQAIIAHQDAATIFRETGDRHHEGIALKNLETAIAAQQA